MGSTHIRKMISDIAMFRTAKSAELDLIAAGSKVVCIPKGASLFRRGDRCTGFYLMLSGGVRLVFTSADGREHVAKIAAAGDHFAEAVMFLDKPYPLDAFATEKAELLFIGKDAVDACLERNPDFARCLIASLSAQLHYFANQIAALTLHSAIERVIGYLLHHIEAGKRVDKGVYFVLPVSKHDVASYLNISPETLSRTFRQLSNLGLMTIKARKVHIPDIERFRHFGST